MIKFLIPAFLIVVSSLAAAPAGPSKVVASANADIKAAANKSGATSSSIGAVVEKYYDYKELGKRALGKTWATMNNSTQEQFSEIFIKFHRSNFQPKAVELAQMQTTFGKEVVEGDSVTVTTTVITKTGRKKVVYKLHRENEKKEWRIWDVITDDDSIYRVYKDQFSTIVGKEGLDGLLARLKKNTGQPKNQGK